MAIIITNNDRIYSSIVFLAILLLLITGIVSVVNYELRQKQGRLRKRPEFLRIPIRFFFFCFKVDYLAPVRLRAQSRQRQVCIFSCQDVRGTIRHSIRLVSELKTLQCLVSDSIPGHLQQRSPCCRKDCRSFRQAWLLRLRNPFKQRDATC